LQGKRNDMNPSSIQSAIIILLLAGAGRVMQ